MSYVTISVTSETYGKLMELANKLGLPTYSDVIDYLINTYLSSGNVVKLSDEVYRKLSEFMKLINTSDPSQAINILLLTYDVSKKLDDITTLIKQLLSK